MGPLAAENDPHPGRRECGRLGRLGLLPDITRRVQRWPPRSLWGDRDGSAQSGGDRKADRVLHPPTTNTFLLGVPVHQVMGCAGAIGADQQITPMSGGDLRLRDCLGKDVDVVGGGAGPGVARTQARGQEFGGVVAPHADWAVAERALVRRRGVLFLLWVTTMVASTASTNVDPKSRPAHFQGVAPPGM